MFSMQQQAEKFGARIEYRTVDRVDRADDGTFVVHCGEESLEARTVIVATGARPRLLGLPNEENGKNGLTTCATCDGAFYRDMPVAVVGGGDSACEEATFLTRFATKVYLVHRRDELRASRIMAERALAHEKVEPVWNTELTAYHPGEDGKMESVSIRNRETGEEGALEVKGVFIAIGHIPNSGFLNGLADLDESGYILQVPGKTATKTPGLYAAGDVADHYYRQAITAAGQGCAAALEAERYLADQED
tara:strand:- start:788 stop:1534 length:747 start_codon:yes stop_codon:yes gene_type:complete